MYYLLRLRIDGYILLLTHISDVTIKSKRSHFTLIIWLLNVCESGTNAIRVAGVVVVGVAVVVDIPEVGSVADIGRTQPPVVSGYAEYNRLSSILSN